MTRYVISPEARHDLLNIWDNLADYSEDAANRLRSEMFAAFERLASFPHSGHRHPGISDPSVRVSNVRHYLVVHSPDARPLQIVRILDGRRIP